MIMYCVVLFSVHTLTPHIEYWHPCSPPQDGSALEPQANRYTELVGSEHRLVFRSVLYTDGGVYNCTADNGRDPPTTASIKFSVLCKYILCLWKE